MYVTGIPQCNKQGQLLYLPKRKSNQSDKRLDTGNELSQTFSCNDFYFMTKVSLSLLLMILMLLYSILREHGTEVVNYGVTFASIPV